ncbi:MAG: hypothetical protein L6R41_004403 [Letrouitia leprolyta]|nr:MAG: hypothetical protein L6R41_004403 [Letrouitia leprolyta]
MSLARGLRSSGSDILVEEDLATYFGRARIDPVLEKQFKETIIKSVGSINFTPIHSSSEIGLDSGLGPTVTRACTSRDRFYMSMVIQISLLSWFLETTDLASGISSCMARRHELQFPDATPDPGYEGILGTIDACSAQTHVFPWAYYARSVEQKLGSWYSRYSHCQINQKSCYRLSSIALLAATDCFYLVQSLPDDRRMTFSNQKGMILIIIWAHYVLGLDVSVVGLPGGAVNFGRKNHVQIVITWKPDYNSEMLPEICLLDSMDKIIFRSSSDELILAEMMSNEKHPLQDYGTLWLRRACNTYLTTPPDSPLYSTLVHHIIAMALAVARRLVQGAFLTIKNCTEASISDSFTIERWRIFDASKIMFNEIDIDMKQVDTFAKDILDENSLAESKRPRALDVYLMSIEDRFRMNAFTILSLPGITAMILSIANITALQECCEVPLVADVSYTEQIPVTGRIWNTRGPIFIEEFDLFALLSTLLVGRRFSQDNTIDPDTFVLSESGWSVILDVVGDKDPSDCHPERLHLRKGVPTSSRTGARKRFVKDLTVENWGSGSYRPIRRILDQSQTYIPRNVTQVRRRYEYCSSGLDTFFLSIRLDVFETPGPDQSEPQKLELFCGYRNLHTCIWITHTTPPCDHPNKSLPLARLGTEVVAGTSLNWRNEGEEPVEELTDLDFSEVPQRICICLTKGDARARWLAVNEGALSTRRRTMLRGQHTCEDCATDAAVKMEGNWLVII